MSNNPPIQPNIDSVIMRTPAMNITAPIVI